MIPLINKVDSVNEYYSKYAKTYDSSRTTPHFSKLNKLQYLFLKENIDLNKRILEVGCGTGEFLKRIPTAVGIDFSEEMVKVAKSKNLNASLGDATRLDFKDNSFDYSFSFKVFAHVPNCQLMLSEMVRVSKIGIVFDFYNFFSLKALKDYFNGGDYIRHDDFNSVKSLLGDLKITVVDEKKHKGYFMVAGLK